MMLSQSVTLVITLPEYRVLCIISVTQGQGRGYLTKDRGVLLYLVPLEPAVLMGSTATTLPEDTSCSSPP
ncbi:hypothetical protein LSM04_008426 [Trypanosoma melophagium]|uniref:uncharacterized protein n=1 Tax=Trypanosoma melophagium TaxID=715481 RepID=UPI003519EEA6|nr:hypothetical protein LSM04_005871 [Trypanosoma melophagium]KAH9601834.1 hypothetical protein LSM04_008426 [Trypanosoma melophagium]